MMARKLKYSSEGLVYIKTELNAFMVKAAVAELTPWEKGRAYGLLELKKFLTNG